MVCEHLLSLDQQLQALGIGVQWRGKSWWNPGASSGEWVYYDCYLDRVALRNRLGLPGFVEDSEYDGRHAGQESGFICRQCNSAVMGNHSHYANGKRVIK